jgi:hypothetical protein
MHSTLPHPASGKQQIPPWGTYTCEADVCYSWQSGPLKVWLKRSPLEWQLAHELSEDEELTEYQWQSLDLDPEGVSWQKWAFSNPHEEVVFRPVMPERPLVVKTLTPTYIPADMEAVFYVNIPLCAMIETQKNSHTAKFESISSVTLSDTWFGNNFEGNLCYALKTRAVRTAEEVKPQPHRALCPISIANKAHETLPLQKICIHAKYLNIYASNSQLWTNRISVSFLGKGVPSKVHYAHTPPAELEKPVLVCKSMERYESGFFKTLGQSFIDLF